MVVTGVVVPVVVPLLDCDVVAVVDCDVVAELLADVVTLVVAEVVIVVDAVEECVVVAVVAAHPRNSPSRYLYRALLQMSARVSHLSLSLMMSIPILPSHLKLLLAMASSTRWE